MESSSFWKFVFKHATSVPGLTVPGWTLEPTASSVQVLFAETWIIASQALITASVKIQSFLEAWSSGSYKRFSNGKFNIMWLSGSMFKKFLFHKTFGAGHVFDWEVGCYVVAFLVSFMSSLPLNNLKGYMVSLTSLATVTTYKGIDTISKECHVK